MTEFRNEIRMQKGIKPPMIDCPGCGERHEADLSVSPRSALFALQKLDVLTDTEMETLDRDWAWARLVTSLCFKLPPRMTQHRGHLQSERGSFSGLNWPNWIVNIR
ncbi:MAG: hypothetical protein ACI9DF_005107 [Verrucomicrobiales bacterium]|jgi:hypothetical protein